MCREFNRSVMRVGLPTLSVDETQVITTWDTLQAYPAASNMHKVLHNARELVVHSSYAYFDEVSASGDDEGIAEFEMVHGADTFTRLLRIIEAVQFRIFTFERSLSLERQSDIVALILPKRIHELRLGSLDDHAYAYFTTYFDGHAWLPLFTGHNADIRAFALMRSCNADREPSGIEEPFESGPQMTITAPLKHHYWQDHYHCIHLGDGVSQPDPFIVALAASRSVESLAIHFEMFDDWSGGSLRDIDPSPVRNQLTELHVGKAMSVDFGVMEREVFLVLRSMVVVERPEEESSHLTRLPQSLETLQITSCSHKMCDMYTRLCSLVAGCQALKLRQMCITWSHCESHSDCKVAQATGYCPWPMRRGCGHDTLFNRCLDFGIKLDVVDATRYWSNRRPYHLTA